MDLLGRFGLSFKTMEKKKSVEILIVKAKSKY
jgi:hypothetical protein